MYTKAIKKMTTKDLEVSHFSQIGPEIGALNLLSLVAAFEIQYILAGLALS